MRFKTVAFTVLSLSFILAALVVVRAATVPSRQPAGGRTADAFSDQTGAVGRLAGALRFPTTSAEEGSRRDEATFSALRAYLANTFVRTHEALAPESVAGGGLLYTWSGTDPRLNPIVLMGHLDVVPVGPETERDWRYPPFSGAVADGFVWGRGALDDKAAVLAILEAAESLITLAVQPRRTVILAFGADEETGGHEGAARIAAIVRSRYRSVEFVVDEGGAVVPPDTIPGIRTPVALIGIAEKGYVSIELTVDAAGGHSSMPPRHTAAGDLSRALVRLEDRPFPTAIRGATAQLFDHLAAEMPFSHRLVFANRWLFGPLITRRLSRSPSTDATIRTTTAATMLAASPKENVLPTNARAVVNFRLLPGDTEEDVLEHVRRTVGPNVGVHILGTTTAASPVASTTSESWRLIAEALKQTFPDAVVAPYLALGASDARHFAPFATNVYRVLPLRLPSEGARLFHGTNERVAIGDYVDAIRFYITLLRSAAL